MTIADLVSQRKYSELEKRADEYIKENDWATLIRQIQAASSVGKTRDAVVSLLQLEVVGGTDSDVFEKFASLEGDNLLQIRASALEHAIRILEEQIRDRHTYFLDFEAMATSPFAVLAKDVIDARRRELEQLEHNPSRIEVLGTYYGFKILMTDGSRHTDTSTRHGYYGWRRRTWLDEKISENAAYAVKKITGDLAEEVDMDKTYRTLGSNRVFRSRCTKPTADILANAVRVTLYKVPGNRGAAARALGRTEDSRSLPFLHHRLPLEQNRRVRMSLMDALGKVGHPSSLEILKGRINLRGRYMSKEEIAAIIALGGIYSFQSRETLIEVAKTGGNTTRAAAIQVLSKQNPEGLVNLITPFLVHKSRPVSRASVLALAELGTEGEDAIRAKADVVIKRIGYDKPSRKALAKMLSIPGVGKMKAIHQYFAMRIGKLEKELENWQNRSTNRRYGYSYYWRLRENRARERLIEYIKLAAAHLGPPFDKELIESVQSVLKMDYERNRISLALGKSKLTRSLVKKEVKDSSHEQTFLSSYR
ncbi:MAG: HEAT repeat domain-containing protein [Candidatus Thorarchaeota archaeon]